MSDQKPPNDSPLNKFLENPIMIGGLMVLVLISAAFKVIDSTYAVILLGVGAFGIFRALQKNKRS